MCGVSYEDVEEDHVQTWCGNLDLLNEVDLDNLNLIEGRQNVPCRRACREGI